MFISFDFAYWGDADTDTIAGVLNTYATHPAAAYYNDGALVSTFIGDYFNWNAVKSQVGGKKLTVLPMLQDPFYITYQTSGIDGAFSWYAWASGGGNSPVPGPMTTAWDQKFISYTDQVNKPYMARKHIPYSKTTSEKSEVKILWVLNYSRFAMVLNPFPLKELALRRRRAAFSTMGAGSRFEP